MARSLKKGPYIHESLVKKVAALNSRNEKRVVKTWSRASTVTPDFVGHTETLEQGKIERQERLANVEPWHAVLFQQHDLATPSGREALR